MTERMNHCRRHGFERDGEILDCAGGRCAVERIDRHLHFAHRVAFSSKAAHRVTISIIKTNRLIAHARQGGNLGQIASG